MLSDKTMYDVVILTDHRFVNPKKTDWYIKQVILEDQILETALEKKGLRVTKKDWAELWFRNNPMSANLLAEEIFNLISSK